MGASGLTGGCQCGAVRYRLDAEPSPVTLCHCRMCQRASGGPFMAFAPTPEVNFALVRGELTLYASSEIAERGFCARCGTPLTYRGLTSGRISVSVGSLDDPGAVVPTGQLGAEFAVPWLAAALATPNERIDAWLKSNGLETAGSHQHSDHN